MERKFLTPQGSGSLALASDPTRAHPAVASFLALRDQVNELFDRAFRDLARQGVSAPSWPSLEVREVDGACIITAELPGLDEQDVEVTFEGGVLTIRGEKHAETENQSATSASATMAGSSAAFRCAPWTRRRSPRRSTKAS